MSVETFAAAFWPLVFAAAASCGERPLPENAPAGSGGRSAPQGNAGAGGTGRSFTPTRKVDLLFVIDDSSFMTVAQRTLVQSFPAFLERLTGPAGLPDLHIAIISTDMGASDEIGQCVGNGKGGIFQSTARGDCATGLASGATYIADDGTNRNYTGNLTDVFTCIARLGESGCGFEHQLAAITRALGADGQPTPDENQGFLRPDAYLFIVVLTNEDDCSAPPGSPLFDPPDSLDAPLGILGNFRCNEFGHLCNGVKPPRLPPSGDASDVVTLDGCHSAEDAGMLIPIANLVAQLRSLKPFPDDQIVVSAIAGPSTPYTVRWVVLPGETTTRPHIKAACTRMNELEAFPSVRIADWVQAFGPNGLFISACSDNYAPAAHRMAQLLGGAP